MRGLSNESLAVELQIFDCNCFSKSHFNDTAMINSVLFNFR